MGRPEGLPKTGGRKKGTPNKKSLSLEAELEACGVNVVRDLVSTLCNLSDGERSRALIHLMAYLYPKRKCVEATIIPQGEATEAREPIDYDALKERVFKRTLDLLSLDEELQSEVAKLFLKDLHFKGVLEAERQKMTRELDGANQNRAT